MPGMVDLLIDLDPQPLVAGLPILMLWPLFLMWSLPLSLPLSFMLIAALAYKLLASEVVADKLNQWAARPRSRYSRLIYSARWRAIAHSRCISRCYYSWSGSAPISGWQEIEPLAHTQDTLPLITTGTRQPRGHQAQDASTHSRLDNTQKRLTQQNRRVTLGGRGLITRHTILHRMIQWVILHNCYI